MNNLYLHWSNEDLLRHFDFLLEKISESSYYSKRYNNEYKLVFNEIKRRNID